MGGDVINAVSCECGWGLLWTNVAIFNDRVNDKNKMLFIKWRTPSTCHFTDMHLIHFEEGINIYISSGYQTFYTKMEFIELIYFINI